MVGVRAWPWPWGWGMGAGWRLPGEWRVRVRSVCVSAVWGWLDGGYVWCELHFYL